MSNNIRQYALNSTSRHWYDIKPEFPAILKSSLGPSFIMGPWDAIDNGDYMDFDADVTAPNQPKGTIVTFRLSVPKSNSRDSYFSARVIHNVTGEEYAEGETADLSDPAGFINGLVAKARAKIR